MILEPIKIGFSRNLLGFSLIIYGGGILCLYLSATPSFIKILLSAVCVGHALLFMHRHVYLNHPHSIHKIWADSSGCWYLQMGNGNVEAVNVQGNSYLCRYGLCLNFKYSDKSGSNSTILLADAMDKASFRRLQAYLRLNNLPSFVKPLQ